MIDKFITNIIYLSPQSITKETQLESNASLFQQTNLIAMSNIQPLFLSHSLLTRAQL